MTSDSATPHSEGFPRAVAAILGLAVTFSLSFSLRPAYSLICIGLPHRGQGSPSPGMTMHFFRYRLLFNLRPQQCFAPSYLKKTNARTMRALARPSNLKIKNQNSGGT